MLGAGRELFVRRIAERALSVIRERLSKAYDFILGIRESMALQCDKRLGYIALDPGERAISGSTTLPSTIMINDFQSGSYTGWIGDYNFQGNMATVSELINPMLLELAGHFGGELAGPFSIQFPDRKMALAFLDSLQCHPAERIARLRQLGVYEKIVANIKQTEEDIDEQTIASLFEAFLPENAFVNNVGVLLLPQPERDPKERKELAERFAEILRIVPRTIDQSWQGGQRTPEDRERVIQEVSDILADPNKLELYANAFFTFFGRTMTDVDSQAARAAWALDRHIFPLLAQRDQIPLEDAECEWIDVIGKQAEALRDREINDLLNEVVSELKAPEIIKEFLQKVNLGDSRKMQVERFTLGIRPDVIKEMKSPQGYTVVDGSGQETKLSLSEALEGFRIVRKTAPPLTHSNLIILRENASGECDFSIVPVHEDSLTSMSCEDLPVNTKQLAEKWASTKLSLQDKLRAVDEVLGKQQTVAMDPMVAAVRARCHMMLAATRPDSDKGMFVSQNSMISVDPQAYDKVVEKYANDIVVAPSRYGPGFVEIIAGRKVGEKFSNNMKSLIEINDNESFREDFMFGVVSKDALLHELADKPELINHMRPLNAGSLKEESEDELAEIKARLATFGPILATNFEAPEGLQFREYQKRSIRRTLSGLRDNNGSLLTMSLGSGKTVVSLATANMIASALDDIVEELAGAEEKTPAHS